MERYSQILNHVSSPRLYRREFFLLSPGKIAFAWETHSRNPAGALRRVRFHSMQAAMLCRAAGGLILLPAP